MTANLQNASPLPSLLEEAWRLDDFTPPFAFSAFFSPEDTLLCVCAAEEAMRLARSRKEREETLRFAELTSGSGLVGLYLLGQLSGSTLLGLDIDDRATHTATHNARLLKLSDRSRFLTADLWSERACALLRTDGPHLLVCNPPYVPEPPGTKMQVEAGAGPEGTAHLFRAIEISREVLPEVMALSWCSLAHPAEIVRRAEGAGYRLSTLYITAIADGEYSGSVYSYLRELPTAYINEDKQTLAAVAPDGSASFAYLLLAGVFTRRSPEADDGEAAPAVGRICRQFADEGVRVLASIVAPFTVHSSILDRWDELELRVRLHGSIARLPAAIA